MSSVRRHLLALFGAGLAAVVSLPARAADTTGPGGWTIDVTIKIDLVGDDALKAKIEHALRDYWNTDLNHNGEPFRFCGKKVKFAADVRIIPPGSKGRPDAHLVNQHTIPSGTYAVSSVQTHEDIAGYDPTVTNATGYWSSNAPEEVVAHELGHMLGLPDEYTYVDKNQNGRRDADEPSTPEPEYADDGSLMAERGGHVLQRQIDEIMDKHGVPDKVYPCTWTGTYDYKITQRILVNGGLQEAHASLKISLKEDKGGFHGTIEGELLQDLKLPLCPSHTVTPARLKAEVAGERRRPKSDHLVPTLELKVLNESWTPLKVSPCPGAGEPGHMNGGRVPSLGEPLKRLKRREADVYQYEKTETLPIPGAPATVTKKVVVQPKR